MRGLLIPPASTVATPDFDPGRRYRLDPDVALRPERFGALAYHYGNRRLNFLRSTLLATVVAALGDHPSPEAALQALVPPAQHPAYRRALTALAASQFIQPCDDAAPPRHPDPSTTPSTDPGESRDDHTHH